MNLNRSRILQKQELNALSGLGLLMAYGASLLAGEFIVLALYTAQQSSSIEEPVLALRSITTLFVFANGFGKILGGSLVLGVVLHYLHQLPTPLGRHSLGIVPARFSLCVAMFGLGLALNLAIHFLIRPLFTLEPLGVSDDIAGLNDIDIRIQLLYLVEISVMAPAIEETLFRGVLYKAFENSCGKIVAAGATTCLFATVHFNVIVAGHWVDIAYLFFISASLLIVREKSGSLMPAILMHAGTNCASFFPASLLTSH